MDISYENNFIKVKIMKNYYLYDYHTRSWSELTFLLKDTDGLIYDLDPNYDEEINLY